MAVALKANALITAAELATMTGKTFASDYANTLINFASDFIENYCNRKFIKQTHTDERYDGKGRKNLYLKNYPITNESATVVKLWDAQTDSLLYTYTRNLEYLVYVEEGYIYLYGKWTEGHRNYRITYEAGYLIADVPYDLKKACSDLCAWMDFNKDKTGLKSEKIGDYSYTMGSGSTVMISGLAVPPEILSLLAGYRRMNV